MKFNYYTLDANKNIVGTNDICEWGEFFHSKDRFLAVEIIDTIKISTVFLGMDHGSPYDKGPPVLFETMIFGGELNGEQERYCSYDEAMAGHKIMVERVKATLNG